MAHLVNILSNLLLTELSWPTGFWENIISTFFNVIKDYGWTIVLFSIVLKIVLIPLDFYQRKSTLASSKKQAIIAPELAVLQKKYAGNKEMINQKTMELYKKHNYNIIGSCFSMLITMAITLTVFFTLFSSMNNISQYKIETQYRSLETAYYDAYNSAIGSSTEEEAIAFAENAVLERYEDVKEGWLWIKNIWRPDTNASIILTYSKFVDVTKADDIIETNYTAVMKPLTETQQGWNGYFILVVLAGVITFLSQKINMNMQAKQNKKKNENDKSVTTTLQNQKPEIDPAASSAKIMMVILPIMMIIFTLSYSGAFALYIITNSFTSAISTFIITKIIHKIDEKKESKLKISQKAEYSR
ncbi:MAG: YidC/Oxa1 family membrane protein insertase [Clostridia bacterium]|nr:YidC/Oxa1 family membrane protein insertase [Clostridia bacterium]